MTTLVFFVAIPFALATVSAVFGASVAVAVRSYLKR